MHQFNVIFEVPVNSFARHVVIAQASPKIPQHQMAVPEGLLRPAFSLFCRSVWKSTAGIRTCKTRERNLCSWMASGSRKCLKFYELELVNFFLQVMQVLVLREQTCCLKYLAQHVQAQLIGVFCFKECRRSFCLNPTWNGLWFERIMANKSEG